MGRLSRLGLQIASVALLATPIGAQAPSAPLPMEPASHWVADYSEDNCALRRVFQAGEDNAVLQLRQYSPGDQFEISVASETLERLGEDPQVRFEPDDHWYVVRSPLSVPGDGLEGFQYTDSLKRNADKAELHWSEAGREARERAITGFAVAGAFERDLVLRTGTMRQPIQALRTCMDAMLERWGLDPAVQRTLSRGTVPIDLVGWSRKIQQYYPATALGRDGRVHVRMIVGADGMPVSCSIRAGEAEPIFQRAACSTMMEYSRFQPALDAAGSPVDSYYVTTIVYASSR
jgi:hypothetical protein